MRSSSKAGRKERSSSSSPSGTARDRGKKIALAGLSVLVSLLLAEAALRILGIGEARQGFPWFAGGNHPRYLFQADPVSGYALRPGFHGKEIAFTGEFEMPVEISPLGMREHPHTAGPHPSLLAIGDSMTFGEGVTADRTWSAVLERESGIRVYNGGVPGYSAVQMAAHARTLISQLHPDFVVATLSPHWDRERCANPFLYMDGYIVSQQYLPRLHLIRGNLYVGDTRLPGIGAATAWAKSVSYVARLALPLLGNAVRGLTRGPEEAFRSSPELFAPTVEALASMRDQAGRSGGGFLALLVESRGPDYEADRINLEKALKAKGIPYLSLDNVRADWQKLHYPRDQHWNAEGHRTVGRVLAPVVRARLSR